jgi:hypothetical protein
MRASQQEGVLPGDSLARALLTFLSRWHPRIAHSPATDGSARDARQAPGVCYLCSAGGVFARLAVSGRRSFAHRVGELGAAVRHRSDGAAPEAGRGSLSLRKSAPPCRLTPNRQRPGGGVRARSRRRRRSTKLERGSAEALGDSPGAAEAEADPASFPLFGLRQALVSVGTLWPHLKTTAAPADTVVQWLGYKHLNRQAQLRLDALRSYGLVEDGPAGVRLSPLAITIVRLRLDRQDGSGAYLRAVQAAALHPRVFRDVLGSHGHASYDALKAHVESTLGFTGRMARKFIAVFRDTLRVAHFRDGASERDEASRVPDEPHPAGGPSERARVFAWPLGPEVSAELRLVGQAITRAHLERLRQYVELASIALDAEPATQSTDAFRLSSGEVVPLLPRRAAAPRRVRRSGRPGRQPPE